MAKPTLGSVISLWDLQYPRVLAAWLRAAAVEGVLLLVQFLLAGLLVSLAFGYWRRAEGLPLRCLWTSAALTLGLAPGTLALAGRLADPITVCPLLLACLAGVWVGWSWVRGTAARIWLAVQLALVLLLMAGIGWQLGTAVLEPAPLGFATPRVTSADKRYLVGLFREAADDDGLQRVQLGPHDLDLLLAWALSVDSRGSKAKVRLGDGSAELQASWALPRKRYPRRGQRRGFTSNICLRPPGSCRMGIRSLRV